MHSNRAEHFQKKKKKKKKKKALLSKYRPPNQYINFLLGKLWETLDIYSKYYENICVFGYINATPENNIMINVTNNQC